MIIRLFIWACLLIFINGSHASEKIVTIGLSLSLTGKYAQMGIMQKKGFDLWQNTINEKNGLLGNKINLLIEDDQSSPDKARSIYTRHIEKTKVDLVIGPYSSGISEAVLPVIEQHRYPTLVSGASADDLWEKGYQYAFGVYTPASKYTVGFLQMLVKYKLKKIAIVSADDVFSAELSKNTKKWAERFGLQVIHTASFKKGTVNLDPVVLTIKSLTPDVIIVCGHLNESVAVRQALRRLYWHPKAYYASVGPAMEKFYAILGHDAELTFSSSQWEIDASDKYPFGKEFVKRFTNMYQQAPSYHAATAFAAGMILELAVQKTNSLDREMLRNMLSQMDTMTLIGRYGVDNNGKQLRHFPLIIQWQQGQKKVVWPEQIKTADPIFNRLEQY
ncbi:MAG: amino acid ABC transporter substrate-binding protein [Pseudomonadota bacterium]